MERAAREFEEQSEGSPRVWFQIVNGTLWVDHSLAPWPDLGWYPAEIGGGARPAYCIRPSTQSQEGEVFHGKSDTGFSWSRANEAVSAAFMTAQTHSAVSSTSSRAEQMFRGEPAVSMLVQHAVCSGRSALQVGLPQRRGCHTSSWHCSRRYGSIPVRCEAPHSVGLMHEQLCLRQVC